MPSLSRFETGVLTAVTAAGLGVAATAALASTVNDKPKPVKDTTVPSVQEDTFELKLPSSSDELAEVWVDGYERYKAEISKVFRFAGQMFVAPIAIIAIDAVYGMHDWQGWLDGKVDIVKV